MNARHVYRCKDGHEPQETVMETPFGESPERHPDCPVCGKRMGKDFGMVLVSFDGAWHFGQRSDDGSRSH